MAERVQVIVEAKDAASGILRGITSQFGALGSVVEELTGTSMNWGNVVAEAGKLAVDVAKQAIDETIKYSDQVRQLSLVSGESAEETSRLIQLTADYNIEVSDLEAATKKLTQNGLSPTTKTLAMLSDEFLTLNPGQERAAFLMDNFGRSGAKFSELMSLGGDALMEMNDAIGENLILTQENLDQARAYTLALDEWNDSVQGLNLALGTELIPFLTVLMEVLSENIEKTNTFGEVIKVLTGVEIANWIADITQKQKEQDLEAYGRAWTEAANAIYGAGDAASEVATNDFRKLLDMTLKLNDATLEQIQQMAYQDLYKQLADDVDGLTGAERDMLNAIGIELGIFDQKAVITSEKVYGINKAFLDGTLSIQDYIEEIKNIPTEVTVTIYENTIKTTTDSNGNPLPQRNRQRQRTTTESTTGSPQYFYGNTTFVSGGGGTDFMESR